MRRPHLGLGWRVRRARSSVVHSYRERFVDDFVFIHINKTGGTSIDQALGLRFRHRTARQLRAQLGADRWARRFSFAFVRNPWDRAVSLYSFRVDRGLNRRGDEVIPFDEWVEQAFAPERRASASLMGSPQLQWLVDDDGVQIVDFVGRFERLSEDFAHVCEVLGRDGVTLPHVKASTRGAYRDYYNDRTRQVVADWFAPDIEAFGYTFGR